MVLLPLPPHSPSPRPPRLQRSGPSCACTHSQLLPLYMSRRNGKTRADFASTREYRCVLHTATVFVRTCVWPFIHSIFLRRGEAPAAAIHMREVRALALNKEPVARPLRWESLGTGRGKRRPRRSLVAAEGGLFCDEHFLGLVKVLRRVVHEALDVEPYREIH